MDVPRRFSYDPQWRLILFEAAIGAAMFVPVALHALSFRFGAIVASIFFTFALLLTLRRLFFRRFLELQPDSLLLPTRFFQCRTVRIAYSEITRISDGRECAHWRRGAKWSRFIRTSCRVALKVSFDVVSGCGDWASHGAAFSDQHQRD